MRKKMNKKKMILIGLSILVVLFAIKIIIFPWTKKFPIDSKGKDIKVIGTLIDDKTYKFSACVRLGDEMPESSAILELELYTKIRLDEKTNKYILVDPKFEINTLGCTNKAVENEEKKGSSYSLIYTVESVPCEFFTNDMYVKSAKALEANKNIEIKKVVASYDSGINGMNQIKTCDKPDARVKLDYKNLGRYFSCSYEIKFDLTSDKEGVFSVK